MKKKRTRIEELRKELNYWQMRTRMDVRSLKSTRNKCKELGEMMRKIQQEK